MTALLDTPSPYGLRVLAELPAFLGERIRRRRETNPDATAEDVAELVVNELNNGQRWQLAVEHVTQSVDAYDRAAVRQVEKESVQPPHAAPRSPRKLRTVDPAVIEQVKRELSEVRELAERRALDMVITLTPELLDGVISLGDGTEVKIGDATADQLTARIDMLERLAGGTVESLARLVAFLNLLRQSGCATLREVTP